jgi:hypothetical protein
LVAGVAEEPPPPPHPIGRTTSGSARASRDPSIPAFMAGSLEPGNVRRRRVLS